ncbi:MAG: phage integrase N-terminal SAM-like domain-containing protein [Rugosibacter sp.]
MHPLSTLLDQVRDKLRVKHYSIETEQSYTDWIKRFIRHFGKTNNSPTSRLTIDSDNRIEEWPLRKVGTPRVLPARRVGDTALSENMAQHMPR